MSRGIETATFHIMTPYPGTRLERRLAAEGRVTSRDWDRYDTRHAVFTPAGMTAEELEAGYWGALPRVLPLAQHLARAPSPTATCASTRATSPTPAAGRSSSRCGTGRSAAARCTASCRCSRRSSTASAAAAGRCRRRLRPAGAQERPRLPTAPRGLTRRRSAPRACTTAPAISTRDLVVLDLGEAGLADGHERRRARRPRRARRRRAARAARRCSSSARIAGAGRLSTYSGNERTTRSADATAASSSSVDSSDAHAPWSTCSVCVVTPRFSSSSSR